MRFPAVRAGLLLAMALVAACGGGAGAGGSAGGATSDALSSPARRPVALLVTPFAVTLPKGTTRQLTATGVFADGTRRDLTASVKWKSSNPAAATVSAGGLVTGVAFGLARISASLDRLEGSAAVLVAPRVPVAIAVSPRAPVLPIGASLQLTATATYDDGSTRDVTSLVAWASGKPGSVLVSADGLVTTAAGALPGDVAPVVAHLGLLAASCVVTVGAPAVTAVAVAPAEARLTLGVPLQLAASATYSDGTTADVTRLATWSSSAPDRLAVSAAGVATSQPGAAAGETVVVTAELGAVSGAATLTLAPAVLTGFDVLPRSAPLPLGASLRLAAVAGYSDGTTSDVTRLAGWSSSAPDQVAVDAGGVATTAPGATVGGAALVTATYGASSASASLTVAAAVPTTLVVSPATAQLRLGRVAQLVATATYSDGAVRDVTAGATWTSSAPAKVEVSATGMARPAAAASPGDAAVVSAALGSATGSCSLAVAAAAAPIGPALANDPLAPQQWHLQNVGQLAFADLAGVAGNDIGVAATYAAGYSGAGVKIAVVDTGLEIGHEDLAANVVPGSWNFLTSTSDPSSTTTLGDHGTTLAGLIGMAYGNGIGGMGVAPAASLNGYNVLSSNQSSAYYVASLGGSSAGPASSDAWVFNESYGFNNTVDFLVDPAVEAQLLSGVTTLRGGRGAVYVKSGGNGFTAFGRASCAAANALGVSCQSANMDPENTLPYNVVVGALNASGVKSSYSTAGSSLWVSAPGGEYGLNGSVFGGAGPPQDYMPALIATDQSGCARGYSRASVTTSAFDQGGYPNTSCNYTSTANGSSAAAPLTTGAVALLLEANPTLTWRDVKHILASTAVQVDPAIPAVVDATLAGGPYVAELPWTTNAAGYHFHDWYGFGLVNVDAAVAIATTYPYGQLGVFTDTGWVSSPALALDIPDASAVGATSAIEVPAAPRDLAVEAVQIAVTATHTYTGDLGIELTSPSGTKSILLTIKNGFRSTTGLAGMVLASNAFYGERSAGTWTLKVVDGAAGHTGALTGWKIRVFGH